MPTVIYHQAAFKPSAVARWVGEYPSGICDIRDIITCQLGHNTITTELHKASAQLIVVNLTAPDRLP